MSDEFVIEKHMDNFIYKGDYRHRDGAVMVNLLLIHFKDEQDVHFIYSPHLDLTGYGTSLPDAQSSFKVVLEDFIDHTIKKGTLTKVLISLGWQIKGSTKRPKKVLAPSITKVISENAYVTEVFDKYSVNTYHQEVGLPVPA